MAAERKVSDDELTRLRHLAADGWTHNDLAAAFGVSPQHVGRLVRGDQRPVIGATQDEDPVSGDVTEAVESYLGALDLDRRGDVLAATVRALAGKLDAAAKSNAAAAAQAMPKVASQLVEVLAQLQERVPREPDAVDHLRARRAARRLVENNHHAT